MDKQKPKLDKNSEIQKPYLLFNLRLLQLGGINAPNTTNKFIKTIFQFYTIFVISIVVIGYTVIEVIGMAAHLDDIDAFTKLMGFALSHFMGCFKIWIWFSKRKQINEIVDIIENGEMMQYKRTKTFETDTVTKTAIRVSRFLTLTDFFLGTALPINASIIAWHTPAVEFLDLNHNQTLYLRKLPYDTWYPFHARIMPFYPLAFFYQVFAIFIFAVDITTLDTFYVGLVIHTTNKIKILNMALTSMRERLNFKSDDLYDSPKTDREMQKMLKKCIIHHQTVIKLTKSVDNLIRFLLLGQFFASMFILCTSLFSLSINKVNSMKFFNEVSYLMAVLFQLFVYCWFGNGITEQSSSVLKAIYECNWFSSSTSFKRSLLIMMIRTQRPLRLNIGIFAPLTLQTYVTVLRGSYSYFAVLKQMDIEEM